MDDDDPVEGCGQVCPITQRIKDVLHQYDGSQLISEMLQNSDDARATKVREARREAPAGTAKRRQAAPAAAPPVVVVAWLAPAGTCGRTRGSG
jgi:hypothetical protein